VRDGKAEGFVSAGNTGAVMAAAKTILGLIPGISRPALVAPIPVLAGGWTMLIDAGANVDCKPKHLAQFALMGSVYKAEALGVARPRVGLLSVGTETAKGNDLTKATFALLQKMPLNFVGNVEGNNLMDGSVDVVVADGFAGNIALKFGETVALSIFGFIRNRVRQSFRAKLGAALLAPVFGDLKKLVDYEEYGGVPLLGVRGCCIIGHGKSSSRAICNALRTADEFARRRVNASIEEQMVEINRRGLLSEAAADEVAAK
jgi:phosphate acyltransferase